MISYSPKCATSKYHHTGDWVHIRIWWGRHNYSVYSATFLYHYSSPKFYIQEAGQAPPCHLLPRPNVSLVLVHLPPSLTMPPSCYLTPPPPLLQESNSNHHEPQAPDSVSEISLHFQTVTHNKQLHWTLSSAVDVLVSQTLDTPPKQISAVIHFLWTP